MTSSAHFQREADARHERVGDITGAFSAQARAVVEDARQGLGRMIEEQPILMAALAAALGAAVGALLPITQPEKDLLGEPGAKAMRAGREALSGAGNVIREEVSAADIGAKVSDIAEQVVQNIAKAPVAPN